MITYSEILLDKFCFTKVELAEEIEERIWALSFDDYGKSEGEVRFRVKDVSEDIRVELIDIFKSCTEDEYLLSTLSEFHFNINKMMKDEWVQMHNEVAQLCPFEVILWMTKNDEFLGRDFLIDAPSMNRKIRPANGLVCFLDTTDPQIFHGVDKLLSDDQIISITGGLGRKEDLKRC